MFDIQDWDLFWGSMIGIGVCDTGLELRFWMQVWDSGLGSGYGFRFCIQVWNSGFIFRFGIQVSDSG